MPLARFQLSNVYGLGLPELYKEANREDPKAVLDGVAVSALVGVLRQLGDLSEFAAEVFHSLQEETMTTASRIHKLMARVKHIETAVPPLEKTILAQRGHLHFAYTAGTDWHVCIQNEQNHFICKDLPRFIMDSYEECHDPPQLHLLDKFDSGGPGSCIKRYSDPTFFKGASASPDRTNAEKVPKNKKDHRIKNKRTCQRNGEVSYGTAISTQFGRMQFASLGIDEHSTQTVSTFDVTLKSDLGKTSNSSDSRTDSGYKKCVFHPKNFMKPEDHESSSPRLKMLQQQQHSDTLDSAFVDKRIGALDDFPRSSYQGQTGRTSSDVTWDEKTEIVEPAREQCDRSRTSEMFPTNFDLDTQEKNAANFRSVDQMDFHFVHDYTPASIFGENQLVDIESEPDKYMDALNTIESESETYLDCQTKQELVRSSNFNDEGKEDGMHGLRAHNPDHRLSDFESHAPAYSLPNEGTSYDKPDSISSESYAHQYSPQMAGKSSNPSNTLDTGFFVNADIVGGSKIESVISNMSSYSGSLIPNVDDSGHNDRFNHAHWKNLNETGVATPGIKQSVTSHVKALSTEASQEDGENSTDKFGLSHRLLVNGFPRKVLLVQDENPESTSSVKSGVLVQKSRNQSVETITFSGTRFKEHFGGGLLVISPPSSPPLEHMKISLQPVNGLENSKLTLKFLDRSYCNENSEDMFRTFQLVPEPVIPLNDDVSENDNDASYRSSPCMSDDCLSHHSSQSNPEQWEASETSQNKDHEFYYALFKISSMDSVSSSMELEGRAGRSIGIDSGLQSPYAGNDGHLLDLQSFNTLNPLFEQEINNDAKDLLELHFLKEPTPQPPPLPPLEWRAIKFHSDVVENKQDAVFEALNHAFNMEPLGSTISMQSEPIPVKQRQQKQNIEELIAFPLKCKPEQLDLNGQKGADQTTNSKSMDENKDFLQQIRTKSFSLRCSTTTLPTETPMATTADVKVAAILEKAHAIRQAVGSDDGEEDDNWSDT
ncbi:protein SCAR3-like isoform X2 [Cornus florida]|uniref:protein SCAR3-like isoform X2 n=1 Tax=Cornus florida TaxID=4283 RepID=UPI00289D43D5|nr:protein SCAR3-like isoform X2 [Cornus florida]